MNTYCLKCRKDAKNIEPKIVRTKKDRLIMQSKWCVCGIKKSRFITKQEAKGLLSNLGIKTPLSKIPLLNVLFRMRIKMNKIINKFYYGPFTKNKERIEKFMQTGNADFVYKNELDKAYFQHDMAYGKPKGLVKEHNQIKF